MRTLPALCIGLLAVLSALPANASPATVAQGLAAGTVIPHFRAVAQAAHAQSAAWSGFCAHRTTGDVEGLRAAYGKVSDAWAAVEFLRMGPGAAELRIERFNYWLDRQNAAGKALNAMLASTDPQSLAPAVIAGGSAAGQGLPILERLIYGDADAALRAPGADGDRRCAIGSAVAANLADIADAIVTGWTAPDGAGPAIAANKGWKVSFTDADEAARVLLTDLFTGSEGLKDFKIAMMFHDEANPGAARLAEDARSGRSLRDIRIEFSAIREAMDAYLAPASAADRGKIDGAFAEVDARLGDIEAAEAATPAHSPERAKATQAALASYETLQQTTLALLPTATGVTLGFNNLDGD